MMRAGQLAAIWSVASLPPMRRRSIGWLPRRWRARAALRVAADIARDVHSLTRVRTKVRRNRARVELRSSLFCAVRAAQPTPLCAFHVAVAVETLRQFGIMASGRVERCHAVGGPSCLVALDITGAVARPDPAIAA
jgi:hypothetical protein